MEQEKKGWTPRGWVGAATGGIRFKPDREAVQAELLAHIEDKRADLRRLYPEMNERELDALVTRQMGDPGQVGRALARLHRPWLGWLWRASQVLLGLILAVTVLLWTPRTFGYARERVEDWLSGGDTFMWYLRGEDPTQAGGPSEPEPGEEVRVDRELVLTSRPGVTAKAGDYTLEVDRLALWRSRDRATGQETDILYFTLTAWGPPWQKLLQEPSLYIAGTDDRGNHYDSTRERDFEDPYLLVNVGDRGMFRRTFHVQIYDLSPGIQWLRLEYDRNGTRWELTIPLAEEEGER